MKNNLPNQQQLNANSVVFKSNTTEFKFQFSIISPLLHSASPSAVSQAGTKPIEKKQWLGKTGKNSALHTADKLTSISIMMVKL